MSEAGDPRRDSGPLRLRMLVAAMAAMLVGCATPGREVPPLVAVQVHDAPARTKADVCRAARDWAAVTFRDSKAVVEVYDLEAGTMIGKGRIVVPGFGGTPLPVDFTLRVECRDGRARSTFDGFFIAGSDGGRYPLIYEEAINNLRAKTSARIAELAASLGAAVAAPPAKDF
jgi:hypothetical protein